MKEPKVQSCTDRFAMAGILSGTPEEVLKKANNKIQLKWLMEAYKLFPEKDSFFILPKSGKMEESFFNKLAGNNDLWQQ